IDPVIHDLAVEVLGTEDVAQLPRRLARLIHLTEPQASLHLAADAARRGDEALRVPREQLTVDARLEVVALDRGQRREPEEIVHALRRRRDERHVSVRTRAAHIVTLAIAPPHPGLVGAVR